MEQNSEVSKLEIVKDMMTNLFVNKYGGCDCYYPPKYIKFYGRDRKGRPRFIGEWACSKCSKVLSADTLIDFEMEINGLLEKSKEDIQQVKEENSENQHVIEMPDKPNENTVDFNINK